MHASLWKVPPHSVQRCRPAHCHAGMWVRGAQNTPRPRVPALPGGPWETLSHTRGHQNSILVFNHGPFEAVPRKIPRRRMVLRTWSFQVRSFCETRTAGNISGVVYSIYFTFLLIVICLLGELRASRIGPGTQSQGTIKPRDFPCLHTRPADGSLQTVNLFPKCIKDRWETLLCFEQAAVSALCSVSGDYTVQIPRRPWYVYNLPFG